MQQILALLLLLWLAGSAAAGGGASSGTVDSGGSGADGEARQLLLPVPVTVCSPPRPPSV